MVTELLLAEWTVEWRTQGVGRAARFVEWEDSRLVKVRES